MMCCSLIVVLMTTAMFFLIHHNIQGCVISKYYKIINGKKLNVDAMKQLSDIETKQFCILKCQISADCEAVNYSPLSKTCELIHRQNSNGLIISVDGWLYSECYPKKQDKMKRDCSDHLSSSCNVSNGVYTIQPNPRKPAFEVFCDMTDGGWTVLQKRFDGSVSFYDKLWKAYKSGFGNLNGEHWLGNDNIHSLTASGSYGIKFDLQDHHGSWYDAYYEPFYIHSENENYRLSIGPYISGTANDSINNIKKSMGLNGQNFTTNDRDNDLWSNGNCALERNSGGWFYNKQCSYVRLNAKYSFNGAYNNTVMGIRWQSITHKTQPFKSLKASTMKVRRIN
ncbi:unnamed protein product [Owenia fusiformis]|uniref:Uncharacterized protein n=1 Tax=Owenia fusiformis TaxID=6347 RepID=A0A8J1TGI7_OWEFU|nr:unnamed protein product [Owenia fusiformis]